MRPVEVSAQLHMGFGCGETGGKEGGRYFRSQAAHNESWPAAGGGHSDTGETRRVAGTRSCGATRRWSAATQWRQAGEAGGGGDDRKGVKN